MDEPKQTIELQIPSRLGCEKVAMNTAASVARLMGFGEDRIEDLKTAISEACINAIEHGNKLDERLSVGVVLALDAESLEIRVSDSGDGVHERGAAPDMEKKMGGEQGTRGMGLFLIESLVDEVEWVRCPRAGTYARMVVRLNPDDAGDDGTGE